MLYPIVICVLAGASTGLGALFAALPGGRTGKGMGLARGFAAGVMVSVSALELIPESYIRYAGYMSPGGAGIAVGSLFLCGAAAGAALTALPRPEDSPRETGRLAAVRNALVTSAVITAHNLPEGMLTVFTGARDIKLGLRTALAVALHNMPEGMAVASPVYYLTGDLKKSFLAALSAGMAEPLGGILARRVLRKFVGPSFLNGFLPLTAGIMCRASAIQFLPDAVRFSGIKNAAAGFVFGFAVMALGLRII